MIKTVLIFSAGVVVGWFFITQDKAKAFVRALPVVGGVFGPSAPLSAAQPGVRPFLGGVGRFGYDVTGANKGPLA